MTLPEPKARSPTRDVIFGEDDRRLVKDHAAQNFSLLTKIALNLLRLDPSAPCTPKKSLRLRRKAIGWGNNARTALLGLTPL